MLSRDSGVVWITPCGRFITRFLAAAEASPCHLVMGIAASSRSPSRRSNWSFISAFSGERYSTPTLAEGFSQSWVSTGRNAASVFPLAVPQQVLVGVEYRLCREHLYLAKLLPLAAVDVILNKRGESGKYVGHFVTSLGALLPGHSSKSSKPSFSSEEASPSGFANSKLSSPISWAIVLSGFCIAMFSSSM